MQHCAADTAFSILRAGLGVIAFDFAVISSIGLPVISSIVSMAVRQIHKSFSFDIWEKFAVIHLIFPPANFDKRSSSYTAFLAFRQRAFHYFRTIINRQRAV